MPDHFCVTRQTAEEFMKLFVNRLAYGIQREKPLADGTVPYIKQTRPLEMGVVRMHLNGDLTINLYAINPMGIEAGRSRRGSRTVAPRRPSLDLR